MFEDRLSTWTFYAIMLGLLASILGLVWFYLVKKTANNAEDKVTRLFCWLFVIGTFLTVCTSPIIRTVQGWKTGNSTPYTIEKPVALSTVADKVKVEGAKVTIDKLDDEYTINNWIRREPYLKIQVDDVFEKYLLVDKDGTKYNLSKEDYQFLKSIDSEHRE